MIAHFDIVGGVVYIDKSLYTDALNVNNDLSKLVGSTCVNMFKSRPRIQSGPESVTVDYSSSDIVTIDQNPVLFIHGLQDHYHNSVRGHLIVDIGQENNMDMIINQY